MIKATGRLYSATVGYYSYTEGARYLNPIYGAGEFSDLVELHEYAHEDLANNNATDGIGRLFALTLERGNEELSAGHKKEIESLLEEIHHSTLFLHEVFATYMSFYAFTAKEDTRSLAARKVLPPYYESALRVGERAFGALSDVRLINGKRNLFTPLLAIAIAAMNPPYVSSCVCFDRLDECIAFIRNNSPNARFRRILKILRPFWESDGAFSDLITSYDGGDINAYQQSFFGRLHERLPSLEFFTVIERPSFFRECVSILQSNAHMHGYRFSEEILVEPNLGDSAEDMGAKMVLPGLSGDSPLDLSVKLPYRLGSLSILKDMICKCQSQGACLFGHAAFNGVSANDSLGMACFCKTEDGRLGITEPFFFEARLSDLVLTLGEILPGNAIFKIDERMSQEATSAICETGHPMFVLLHDTKPRHILDIIRKEAQLHEVLIMRLFFPGLDYCSFVIAKRRDGLLHYMAPFTKLGIQKIAEVCSTIKGARLSESDQDTFKWLQFRVDFVTMMIASCYIGN